MSSDEVQNRLQEIYAAVEEVAAIELQKPQLVATPIIVNGLQVGVKTHWDIEKSDAKYRVFAYSVIDAIAVLYAAVLSYGKTHGISEDEINQVTEYDPLRIIRDLHNVRKHPEMMASESGKNLQLRDLQRGMKLGPRPMEGVLHPHAAGSGITDTGGAILTIEGNIVDAASGAVVASLGEVISQSLARWEEFLRRHSLM